MAWTTEVHGSIHDISEEHWDALLGPHDILVLHRHLAALEDSGVAAPDTGFEPSHVALRDEDGSLVAAAPTYLRSNSKSELGVDLGLQMAHERVSGPYYPKLQVEVPMMPQAGQRLLVRSDIDRKVAIPALFNALKDLVEARGASSLQISFMLPGWDDRDMLRDLGMTITESNTFAWVRGSETSWDEYLGRMTSHYRAKIKRERRIVRDQNLTFRYLRGKDLTPDWAEKFFEPYVSTYLRHSSDPAFNLAYFQQVFATMPEHVDFSVSFDGDELAGALYGINDETSGHCVAWGQAGDIRYLHFEQVIHNSIERGLVTGVDKLDFAGLGSHKAVRGLRAEPVYHAFWFKDPAMTEVIEAICTRRNKLTQAEREKELELLPFVEGRD